LNHAKQHFGRFNVAILATDGKSLRKVGWITTGPGGITFEIARAASWGMKYNYHTDGGFYRTRVIQTPSGPRETQEFAAKHPPLLEIKGLERLLSAEIGAGDRLRGFPFRGSRESIYVRTSGGKASFTLGLLEPNTPHALDALERGKKIHFRLITKTKPWIAIWNTAGFEARPNTRR
jgi:hypothetical protein